jgi:hypothetical protein
MQIAKPKDDQNTIIEQIHVLKKVIDCLKEKNEIKKTFGNKKSDGDRT